MRSRRDAFTVEMGAKLRQFRLKSGLTLTEVARRMGRRSPSGKAYLSQLEQGRHPRPTFVTILKYLQACSVRPDDFLRAFYEIPKYDVEPEVRRAVAPVRAAGGFVKSGRAIAAKTARTVHRWQERTAFSPEPHMPDARERTQRARHFASHRARTAIVDETVERKLMHLNVHPVDHLKYFALAHLTLSRLFPTGKVKRRGRLNRADYARAQGLDPEVAKAVRDVVRRLARSWSLNR